jgi:hypothetical protein
MEICSCDMLITNYSTTQHHNPDDNSPQFYHTKNLRLHQFLIGAGYATVVGLYNQSDGLLDSITRNLFISLITGLCGRLYSTELY